MKPNVLFFFTDDQRFDTIHALGCEAIHTPNLDALVEAGTTFTHAHIMGGSSGAVCMPSRAMLHTGRTLWRIKDEGQTIDPNHALLGEHFGANGYETFGTGKWHNSPASYARSFDAGDEIMFGGMADHWNVPMHHFDPTGQYAARLPACKDAFHSNEVVDRHADHVTAGTHSTDLLADAACEFLRTRDGSTPFLAYVAFLAPHDPRTMPKEFRDLYDPADMDLDPNYMPGHPFDSGNLGGRDEELEAWPRTKDAVRRHMAEYYAMISHADARIGQVIETLKQTGQYDNTIIVFAGDNGLALGRHGLMGKQNLYEHSIRVPLILAGPGVPAGERRDAFAYLIDIFPTLCDLTGLETPATVDGLSLTGVMTDPAATLRETLLTAYLGIHRSVKDRRHKLIEYVVGEGDETRRYTQLFDLQEDPWELTNLAGCPEHAETCDRLRTELRRWQSDLADDRPPFGQRFWSGFDRTEPNPV